MPAGSPSPARRDQLLELVEFPVLPFQDQLDIVALVGPEEAPLTAPVNNPDAANVSMKGKSAGCRSSFPDESSNVTSMPLTPAPGKLSTSPGAADRTVDQLLPTSYLIAYDAAVIAGNWMELI